MAVVEQLGALGYSGKLGVGSRGRQPLSAGVRGLPSWSPFGMALNSRQSSKWSLASQQAMDASALAVSARANNRAVRRVLRCNRSL